MDDSDDIKYLQGRLFALEKICQALYEALPSSGALGSYDAKAVFLKRRDSFKRELDHTIHSNIQDPTFKSAFTKTINEIGKAPVRRKH